MTEERFLEIFEEVEIDYKIGIDSTLEGLKIMSKYSNRAIQGADHDIIYCEDIETLIEAGVTEEEVTKLRKYGFMIEDGSYIAHFV